MDSRSRPRDRSRPESEDQARPLPDPRCLALKRLAVREYGASEMAAYLRRRGIGQEEAERVVARLVADRMIDDTRFARMVARDQALRDKGSRYIAMKLKAKGVRMDRREVDSILRDVLPEEDELARVRAIVARRYPGAARDQKERNRAYQGLLRRGFSPDAVRRCLFQKGGGEPPPEEPEEVET
jgi:regulatory protein